MASIGLRFSLDIGASIGKAKLKEAIDRTRALLGVPADFKIAIVPASDTGKPRFSPASQRPNSGFEK